MHVMKGLIVVVVIFTIGGIHSVSAQENADLAVFSTMTQLRITELMANPAGVADDDSIDNDLYEFIELKNLGETPLDITNVTFSAGVRFAFKDSLITSLAPGELVLIVQDQQAFEHRYGQDLSDRIAGQYTGRLSNGGERITLEYGLLGTIMNFTYGDNRGWPLGSDGAGHSLVPLPNALAQPAPDTLDYAGNWRRSIYLGGSPGTDNPELEETVVINELMANAGPGQTDFAELYNRTETPIDLTGWYLSDDLDDLPKSAIPAQTTLAGLTHSAFFLTGDSSQVSTSFRLRGSGEQLVLSYLPDEGPGGIRDAVAFKAQTSGSTLGRYPDGNDGWFTLEPSHGNANSAPIAHLTISEIMYHPTDPNLEYLEIVNATNETIVLGSLQALWRLNGGVEYVFPVDTVIQPQQRVVVVSFNPAIDTGIYPAFAAAYTVDENAQLFGPWSGNLANGSERIALEKAQDATAVDNLDWILIDEVTYGDQYPWPVTPDGQGDALHRIDIGAEHNSMNPANWQAAAPTPGAE